MKKTTYETKILSRDRNSAETGRSMVEMLGVLAIVGVISIGGIAGYNYGMNRYRTNELLDGANKRAYTVATQKTLGIPLNLSEFKEYDATAGGTFQTTVQEWQDDGEFGIQVTGVKKEVCENILRMIGDNTPLRALSKVEGESEQELQSGDCADGDTNAFSFVYNVEMLSKGANPGSPSGVSSIGGESASSSTGSGSGGNYCVTHPGECTLTCGADNFPCVKKFEGNGYYDDAKSACDGDEKNMVTVTDLGCTELWKACTKNPPTGVYWVTGNLPEPVDDMIPSHKFYIDNGKLGTAPPDTLNEVLCK